MRYGSIPHVNRPVSRVVFGTATPTMFQAFRSVYGQSPDFEQRLQKAFSLLDAAYAEGINCFDCADHYGEEPLGEWLETRSLHDKVAILTKGAHHNAWRKRVTVYDILHDVHNSLAKLKTNHIQLYLLHRDDTTVPVGPIVDVLNRLYDEGKIGAFGASNWTVKRFIEANEYAAKHNLQPFTVVSPNFCLADQVNDPWGGGCTTISGTSHAEDRRFYAENKIPVLAYSALGRGFFSGRMKSGDADRVAEFLEAPAVKGYACTENFERLRRCEILAKEKGITVPELAVGWIFNQKDLDVYALVSTGNPARIPGNVRASEIDLTESESRWLNLED